MIGGRRVARLKNERLLINQGTNRETRGRVRSGRTHSIIARDEARLAVALPLIIRRFYRREPRCGSRMISERCAVWENVEDVAARVISWKLRMGTVTQRSCKSPPGLSPLPTKLAITSANETFSRIPRTGHRDLLIRSLADCCCCCCWLRVVFAGGVAGSSARDRITQKTLNYRSARETPV